MWYDKNTNQCFGRVLSTQNPLVMCEHRVCVCVCTFLCPYPIDIEEAGPTNQDRNRCTGSRSECLQITNHQFKRLQKNEFNLINQRLKSHIKALGDFMVN